MLNLDKLVLDIHDQLQVKNNNDQSDCYQNVRTRLIYLKI